jgi:hypothetical protein
MYQKGSSPILWIVIVAVIAALGYMVLGSKKEGEMAKTTPPPAPVTQTAPAPSSATASVASSDPDAIVSDIITSIDEESTLSDPTADVALIGNDADAINSYVDAYDATSF